MPGAWSIAKGACRGRRPALRGLWRVGCCPPRHASKPIGDPAMIRLPSTPSRRLRVAGASAADGQRSFVFAGGHGHHRVSALSPDCFYRVVGICYWLFCTPFGCSVRTLGQGAPLRARCSGVELLEHRRKPWIEVRPMSVPNPTVNMVMAPQPRQREQPRQVQERGRDRASRRRGVQPVRPAHPAAAPGCGHSLHAVPLSTPRHAGLALQRPRRWFMPGSVDPRHAG